MSRGRSFPPVVDARTRVLVLGSLPGARSLAAAQYYAHPQNGFWRLVGGVIGSDLQALAYPDRLAALLAHGVGLWDVIDEAERAGSLDAAIRAPRANDLVRLVARLPELRAIGFNGATAARLGRRALSGAPGGPALLDLPSSSPAYTRPLAVKAETWAALGGFLERP